MRTLLVFVLAITALGCGPKEEPMPVAADQITPEAKFVNDMKAKAKGDIANLSAEERKKLDQVTRGNAEVVIKSP